MICVEEEGRRKTKRVRRRKKRGRKRTQTKRNSLEWGEEQYGCPDGTAPGPTALQRPSPRP